MPPALTAWLASVAVSLAVSIVTFWGLGGLVHYHFYLRNRARAPEWKLQPDRFLNRAQSRHALFWGGFNLALGSLVGATFAWHVQRGGHSSLYFDVHRYSLIYLPLSALLVFFAIDAGLYYSHRALHNRLVFRYVHRWHHKYVAPTIFTTTAMHPLEFVVFMFFLLLPALIIPVHVGVYLLVIGYTYLIGMIDHSGIRVRWRLPLHSDNRFHDDHHVYFHCNYGHHTALWDRLHRTVHRSDRHYDEHTYGGHGAPIPERTEHARPDVSRAQ